jgi:ParB-like chromosome segregation protein Spo0J
MYKAALKEMIVKLDLKEKGVPLTVTGEMTEDEGRNLIIKAIEILNENDYFSKETTATLAILGWDRKTGWDKSKLEVKPLKESKPIEEFEPIETMVEESATSLPGFIGEAKTLKELKEICKSEPEFKSIRGSLASFKDMEGLRREMIGILENPIIPGKLHEKIEKEHIRIPKVDLPSQRDINLIMTRPPFSSLFEVNKTILNVVTENMQKNGYDSAFPIILWGDIIVDGHTRLKAAILNGLDKVPVEVKEFKDEKEALKYAIHNQRDRRNLGDAELLRCIREIDQPLSKVEAGAKGGKGESEHIEPTHKVTAKVLGLGQSVVSDARTVLADEEATKEVEEGKTTIRKAAKKVRAAKQKPKEVIVEPKTLIEVVAKVLRESAGEEVLIPSIVEKSSKLAKEELAVMEEVVNNVLEVCIALRLVKVLTGDKIAIKKILK